MPLHIPLPDNYILLGNSLLYLLLKNETKHMIRLRNNLHLFFLRIELPTIDVALDRHGIQD